MITHLGGMKITDLSDSQLPDMLLRTSKPQMINLHATNLPVSRKDDEFLDDHNVLCLKHLEL